MITKIAVLLLAAISVRAQDGTGSVTGAVRDILGTALPNAAVTVESPGGSRRQGHTDENGVYHFMTLSAGEHLLKIVIPGFATFTADFRLREGEQKTLPAVEPMVSSCGDPRPYPIHFLENPHRFGKLAGRLIETTAPNSPPIGKAKINARCRAGQGCSRTTTTDSQGRFVFDDLAPGVYDIDINGAPYRDPFRQGAHYSAGYTVQPGFEMSYSFPMHLTRGEEAEGVKMTIDGKVVTVFLCE